MAGNPEPQHILLNKITAFYLHSAALQKYLFFVWLSCLFCTIPTARGRGSVVPGDTRAPPARILGDPAGVMGSCCCSVASRLWVTVRGSLTALRAPVQQGLQARRAPLGVRWACGARKGACAKKSLDQCGDPRQPGQAPERVEGQPGPASEMSFSTLKTSFRRYLVSSNLCLYFC